MPEITNTAFSNRALGWSFVIIAVALTAMMAYVIVQIVQPLTAPTSIATGVIQTYAQQFTKEPASRAVDEETVRFLIGLEYSTAAIRTVSVQVAFASVGGFFLIVMGILLFASGAIRPMSAQASDSQRSLNLQELAPGTFIALLGAVVLGLGVTRDMTQGEINYSHKTTGQSQGNPTVDFNASSSISTHPLPNDPRYKRQAQPKGAGIKP